MASRVERSASFSLHQRLALVAADVRARIAIFDRLEQALAGLVTWPRVRGPIVHDARVAAICIAHGVETLLSRDRDFTLFPEVNIENPFASST